MSELEARILRIEQILGLAPIALFNAMEEVDALHHSGYSIPEAYDMVKKSAIQREFTRNIQSSENK